MLSVSTQRCQSHYSSTTPCIPIKNILVISTVMSHACKSIQLPVVFYLVTAVHKIEFSLVIY